MAKKRNQSNKKIKFTDEELRYIRDALMHIAENGIWIDIINKITDYFGEDMEEYNEQNLVPFSR